MFKDLCKQISFEPVLLQANDKQGTDKFKNKAVVMSYMFFSRSPNLPHQRVHVHHDQPGRDLHRGYPGGRGEGRPSGEQDPSESRVLIL